MMNYRTLFLGALLALCAVRAQAQVAVPYVPQITGTEVVGCSANPPGPQTTLCNIVQLREWSQSHTNFRNLFDNGAMDVVQRGAASTSCGGTTGTGGSGAGTGYNADRWACIVNVGSQAGKIQQFTTTPPLGFAAYSAIWRNGGSLAQPVCAFQEIPTADAIRAQGQYLVISGWLQALAGLSADNGNVANLVIITGTNSSGDQALGTMTASPAITPAWTGVATPANQAFTITTNWARYQSTVVPIGATVTEIVAGVCFTPTTTSTGGSTDGLNFTGMQLEILPSITPTSLSNVALASAFEFRPLQVELLKAQKYFYAIFEPAAGVPTGLAGVLSTTTNCVLNFEFPAAMRVAPTGATIGSLSTSTFRIQDTVTSTLASTFIGYGTNSAYAALVNATLTTASTAGFGCTLQGANATAGVALSWSAEF